MVAKKGKNRHLLLSAWIIVCGLLYIFAYQFVLPFEAEVFLYGMVFGIVGMTLLEGRIVVSRQAILFVFVAIASFVGVSYTSMPTEGLREAVLFAFFAGMFWLSLTNPSLIKSFTNWIFLLSIVVVLSSVIQFLMPMPFVRLMEQVLREEAYQQLAWSYAVDNAYAGVAAYTPNTTFAAAVVFGHAFLNLTRKQPTVIKNRIINIALLVLSVCAIILCSKRGVFAATMVALIVLMFYLYRGKDFFLKFISITVVISAVLVILYNANDVVATFLNRFIGDDVLTGRDIIYESLLNDMDGNNILLGEGTAATYAIADAGAHNIYLQIFYDHGVLFSIPYFFWLIYNYVMAFKNKCPLSIFIQTMFLVYGLSGNPLYSNMFVMIYIYYVLYASRMSEIEQLKKSRSVIEKHGNAAAM